MQNLHVTDNIELRMLCETDADELLSMHQSWTHAPQLEEAFFGPQTIDGALTYIRQGFDLHAKRHGIVYGIRVNGCLAGLLQLERKQYGRTVGMDYGLAPAYRGQGIVTCACATALNCVFMEWNMHRAEMWIDVVNQKSCAVAERLGFIQEGVHRQRALYGNDWWGDIAVYALLKDEWERNSQVEHRMTNC